LDIQGVSANLFPPTQVAVGVTADPTKSSLSFTTLTDMDIDVTPPADWPLWEARLQFSGQFSIAAAYDPTEVVYTRFAQDGVEIANTRVGANPLGNGATFPTETFYVATVIIPGGVTTNFTTEWAGATVSVITATGVARMMTVTLRPYTG